MHTGFADRVKDTTTTTGTGSLTLSGTAPTGYRAFGIGFDIGNRVYYCISSSSGSEWEVGLGTLTASTTLARTQVFASSNSNNVVNLSAGTKDVFCTFPAQFANSLSRRGIVEAMRTSLNLFG